MSDYLSMVDNASLRTMLREMQTRLERLEQRNVQAGAVNELAIEMGEMSSGADVDGPNLIVNGDFGTGDSSGWSGSTGISSWAGYAQTSGAYSLASDRVGVTPGALLEGMITAAQVFGSVPVIEWFAALSGGSLVGSDELIPGVEPYPIGLGWIGGNGYRYERRLRVPSDALAARMLATGSGTVAFASASMREITRATRFSLEPVPGKLAVDGVEMRLAAGAYHLAPPPGPFVTATPLGVGSHYYYTMTLVDSAGGETTPGGVTRITTSGNRNIVMPVPAGNHRLVRLYRCTRPLANLAIPSLSEFALLAELPAGTVSYTDSGGATTAVTPPAENTAVSRPVLATSWRQLANSMRSRNGLTRTATSSQTHGEYWTPSDEALYDWIAPDGVLIEAGRYEIGGLFARASTGGQVAVLLDGRGVGTINLYNASAVFNYSPTLTVVVEEPGYHEFLLIVTGTSASGYRLMLSEFWGHRVRQ